jgi:hypothetical protein
MTATSLVDDGVVLRRALFDELQQAADAARYATNEADDSLTGAVHSYRKALRRTRALLRLVWRELPKHDRRDIERALTESRRSLGAARDHAVAGDVLGDVTDEDERRIARAVLDCAAVCALASHEIKQLIGEGAARTAAQLELIDAALPPRIEWRAVLDGLRATYAKAREARRDAKRSRRAFHTWRRRSKELAIQLDVLGKIAGPAFEELRERIVTGTDDLGEAVDLLMARDFVRTHAVGIDKHDIDKLVRALTRDLDVKIREGRRTSRDAFRTKPRKLARKLAKAAHGNVTPVSAPPPSRAEEFALT